MTASAIGDYLAELHARLKDLGGGAAATYIPELAKADPAHFGVALMTVDGALYEAGDTRIPFTIQSVSKAFVYGHALDVHGRARVLDQVGVEPSGDSFNSIELDEAHNRPFNPMVNAGAIATAELIEGADDEARRATLRRLFHAFAGQDLALDEAVYLSEKATGHRNRAIAWLMLNSGMIAREPEGVLDLYFRQCSLLVDAGTLATMGATLANGGINPLTGARAISAAHVPDVLTVMNSCGMYNYAGQWAYEVGLPAKSGVAGSILAIVPGQAAIVAWSPPIDERGNSVRGVAAIKAIAQDFGLHIFESRGSGRAVIRRTGSGAQVRSKRARTLAELQILRREGHRIRIVEAQDALFFGSTEMLLRSADAAARLGDWLIVDFERASAVDAASIMLLQRFRARALATGDIVLFSNLRAEGPLAGLHAAFADHPDTVFETRDRALEHCENQLIEAALSGAELVERADLFSGLAPDDRARLAALGQERRFDEGVAISREGDPASEIYVLVAGSANVVAEVEAGEGRRTIRLGAIGPGTLFGEGALLAGGMRTANVIADRPAIVLAFPVDQVEALGREAPHIMVTLLGNLARSLAQRLRIANEEIRAAER